jgi:hypothetical protein
MDALITQLLSSGIGEATKVMVEKLLNSDWISTTRAAKKLLSQMQSPALQQAYLEKHAYAVLRMRTLHNQDYDILLDDIYYPLTIEDKSRDTEFIVNDGAQILSNSVVNIIGIAGQGKSTILRKLFLEEIRKHRRLPFFLELRRIENGDIFQYLQSQLDILGFETEDNAFEQLLASGKLIIFLDGFDEVKDHLRSSVIQAITEINIRFSCPVIVTSRPDTEICKESGINNLFVKQLTDEDKCGILKKLATAEEFNELSQLLRKNSGLAETLVSPILITLLYACYPYWDELPRTVVDFYRNLFTTLYRKHDRLKAWTRERRCRLQLAEIQWCFSAMCLFAMEDEVYEFDDENLRNYAARAIDAAALDEHECEGFLHDIINVTCLIQPDGLNRYVFLHKSLQEYHAAYAVKILPEDYKEIFYNYFSDKLTQGIEYDNVLFFLCYIDEEWFRRKIMIERFDKMGFSDLVDKDDEALSQFILQSIDDDEAVCQRTNTHEEITYEIIASTIPKIQTALHTLRVMAGKQREILLHTDIVIDSILDEHIHAREFATYNNIKKPRITTDDDDADEHSISLADLFFKSEHWDEFIFSISSEIYRYHKGVYLPIKARLEDKKQALSRGLKLKI